MVSIDRVLLPLYVEDQSVLFETKTDGFHEALQSVAREVVPNIDGVAIKDVARQKGMSWRMFEAETAEFVDRKKWRTQFDAIDGVDDDQWVAIYDAMTQRDHSSVSGEVMLRKHLYEIHFLFYKQWLSKCYVTALSVSVHSWSVSLSADINIVFFVNFSERP